MAEVTIATRPWRLLLILSLLAAGFGLVQGRLVTLQVLGGERYAHEAERMREGKKILLPRRGAIYDRNGHLLASTKRVYDLGVDPVVYRRIRDARKGEKDWTKEVATLAAILNIEHSSLVRDLEAAGDRRQWIPLGVLESEAYRDVLNLGIPGVYGNERHVRHYPGKELACHVLGFVNRQGVPGGGVEMAMNYYLRGERGWIETEHDGARRELTAFRRREVPARPGMDIYLSIDIFMQEVVEQAIEEIVESYSTEAVSVIASDPRTGEILALANYPRFDPNRYNEYPPEMLRNRALSDTVEPGSTFKIVPVSAALDSGMVTPDTVFDCALTHVVIKGRRVDLPDDIHQKGELPVREIVARSSNRGAALIGVELGLEALHRAAQDFGFGLESGLGLAGESRGIFHPLAQLRGTDYTRLPIGYVVGVTPIQMHQAMATVANGGELIEPRVVRMARFADQENEILFPSRVRWRVIKPATAATMRELLLGVTEHGTARRARIEGIPVAGKTGTTRKVMEGDYSTENHISSFTGFFPADDPVIALTVIADDAQTEGTAYGGTVSAPAFSTIGSRIARYLAISKESSHPELAVHR